MPIGPLGAVGQHGHANPPNLGPMNDPNDINTLDPAINPQFQTLDPMQMLDVDKDVVPSTPPNQVTPLEQTVIGYLTAQPIAYKGFTPEPTLADKIDQAIADINGIPLQTFQQQQALLAIQEAAKLPFVTYDQPVQPLGVPDPDAEPASPAATTAAQVSSFGNTDTGYGYGAALGSAPSGVAGFGIGSIGAPGEGSTVGGYGFGIGASTAGDLGGFGFGAPSVGDDGSVGLGAPSGIAGVSSGDLGGQSVSGVTGQGFGDPGDGSSTGTASVGAPGSGTSDGFGAGATGVAGVSEGGALGGGVGIGGLGGGIGDGSSSGGGVGDD